MRYSVLLEAINEPDFEGYYYAHIPTLDLTTHGEGVEGALAAAQELVEAWIGEKQAHGESVPVERKSLIAHVDIYVAMHPGTLPTGTFRKILKQAGLSEEQFRAL